MNGYPPTLLSLIAFLKKLPGVGSKTAERFAFHLLAWEEKELGDFADLVSKVKTKILSCRTCGCLQEKEVCPFCNLELRDPKVMCVISSPKDVYLFEQTHTFKGCYHVLGPLLSPLDGKSPDDLHIDSLMTRLEDYKTEEVIIALDSTLEGDATALFLKEALSKLQLRLTRIAFGLPIGSTLDYIDGSTLTQALSGRQNF